MRMSPAEFEALQKRRTTDRTADPKAKLQALGRLKDGEMNKTEAAFAQYLEAEKQAGRVLWYAFETVKLKLAPNCHLTVDFFVLDADSRLCAIDVKGSKAIVSDDALVKLKVAANTFPWAFYMAFPRPKKDGGGWSIEAVGS